MAVYLLPWVKVYDHCEIQGNWNTITGENINLVGKRYWIGRKEMLQVYLESYGARKGFKK
jgi:hypothetical protein